MESPVTYDRRSFKLNGEPFLILSGSVHYIRVHPSRWDELFQTFLDAKLNTLETYVFWGSHERPAGTTDESPPPSNLPAVSYDFSGRLDLFGFIEAAGQKGLKVVLRIGPYVCAEVSYGGFPFRLRDVPGLQFRTYNEPFMQEVERWVRYVARRLHERRLLASSEGPVILVQLENEYSMVSDAYGDTGARYLQWCANLQRELDFGVPAIMCYGAADGVVETINSFYAHREISAHRSRHPDQPPVWTECWTGWYDVWGAPHHRRPVADLAYAVARFFAAGGAGVNYYMWMGGTNFGREGMYLQASSYDYDAPVDEHYGRTSKFMALKGLHEVLGKVFEAMFMQERDKDPGEVEGVTRWGDALFLCNDDEEEKPIVLKDVPYQAVLAGRSVQIVTQTGELLYDTARVADRHVVDIKRVELHTECVTEWCGTPEPVPLSAASGDVIGKNGLPPEGLSVTQDRTDYIWYTATFEQVNASSDQSFDLVADFQAADLAAIYVNGTCVGRSATPLWEDRFRNKWNTYADCKPPGMQQRMVVNGDWEGRSVCVTVLVVALGLVKGDWQLGESANMLQERKGLLSDVRFTRDERTAYRRTSEWAARAGPVGISEGGAGAVVEGCPAWWECVVELPWSVRGWDVDLSGCGKGMMYVDEQLVGRFWDVDGTRGRNGFLDDSPIVQEDGGATQRFYCVPGWMVRGADAGERVEGDLVRVRFVLFVENGRRPPGRVLQLFQANRS